MRQEALVAGVLQQLADCLADGCAAVVRAAQATLRRLLHTPLGAAALGRVPEPARSYVGVFQPAAGAPEQVPCSTTCLHCCSLVHPF